MVPWGLRKLLNYIYNRYENTPLYVTENGKFEAKIISTLGNFSLILLLTLLHVLTGMDDEEDETKPVAFFLNDEMRIRYYKGYLLSVAQSIR